jgi:transcription elongation GreA/GreB family factor
VPDVLPDKRALAARWRVHLEGTLAVLQRTLTAARGGMDVVGDRPDNRMERAAVTSQGYLADGLARRIEDVCTSLALLDDVDLGPSDRVRAGSLVGLDVPADEEGGADAVRWVLLLPGGDGTRLEAGGVTVLAPTSPWARALRGLEAGDDVRLDRPGGPVRAAILHVV